MEDSPGSHPGPQGRSGTGGSQAEPAAPAAPAEQGTEPAPAGSDPDDDNGWLPV
jgi:hypothetical protein